jgi:hypothetical protein
MIKCTIKEVFETAHDNIGEGEGEVIICVIMEAV